MKNLFKIILLAFVPLHIAAQDIIRYDLKKQINHVFQDSLYEAFEEALSTYPVNSKEYIQSDIFPLKFATQYKGDGKTNSYKITIEESPNQYNVKFKFDQYGANNANCISFLEIDPNKLLIQSQKDNKGTKYINTYLNSFTVSNSCDNDDSKIWLSKSFFCKTHVISNEYIDINTDFKILNIFYYNTLAITSSDKKNKFEIIIYEKVNRQQNLLMRKVIIKGDKEKAIDYLKKYNINYSNIDDINFKEMDFQKI